MRWRPFVISCATPEEPCKDAPQLCVAKWPIALQSLFSFSHGDSSIQTLSYIFQGVIQWPNEAVSAFLQLQPISFRYP